MKNDDELLNDNLYAEVIEENRKFNIRAKFAGVAVAVVIGLGVLSAVFQIASYENPQDGVNTEMTAPVPHNKI